MNLLDVFKTAQIDDISRNLNQVVGVVALSILAVFSRKIKTWWKDRPIKQFEKKILENMKIRDFLAEIRVLYSADRVYIMQFHNGGHFFSGESSMKCSLTHIVLNDGVAMPDDNIHHLQNIPTSCYILCLEKMKKVGECFSNPTHAQEDPFLSDKFAKNGTKSSWHKPIRDSRGNWIGFLSIEWLSGVGQPSADQLTWYCSKIGAHLSED